MKNISKSQFSGNSNVTVKYILCAWSYIMTLCAILSCNKLVNIKPNRDTLGPQAAYADSSEVQAVISGMYNQMYNSFSTNQPYGAGITFLNGLYADELTNPAYPQFQDDALPTADPSVAAIWSDSYANIYRANAIIAGVQASTTISATVKASATGEAEFIRAFCHFYLVNIFGNVPLITSTNTATTALQPQVSSADVYKQIISDLKDAATKLPSDYSSYSGARTRVNKYAAISLLAKVYLYTADYPDAETEAGQVINNTSLYSILPDENQVFLANSNEAIWEFDSSAEGFTYLGADFLPAAGAQPPFIITNDLLNAFEPGDTRKTNWIGISDGFAYPAKYKTGANGGPSEFDVVLRLADQYLIRAEAEAQQNNITGARADINVIRNRAGLANTTAADKASLLTAVYQERRVELFCEWANRFFDLKRTGLANTVLGAEKPAMWKSTAINYPIPAAEISKNHNLVQNPGY